MAAWDIEVIWQRIVQLAGEESRQKQGKPFTYGVRGGGHDAATTRWFVSKENFAQALAHVPLSGPGAISSLQGPSYVYALVMDERIH